MRFCVRFCSVHDVMFNLMPPVLALQAPPAAPTASSSFSSFSSSSSPHNSTLLLEHLPEDCDASQLQSLFNRYPGCKDIRLIASKKVAFIDYDSIPQASQALRGKRVVDQDLHSYVKKRRGF